MSRMRSENYLMIGLISEIEKAINHTEEQFNSDYELTLREALERVYDIAKYQKYIEDTLSQDTWFKYSNDIWQFIECYMVEIEMGCYR